MVEKDRSLSNASHSVLRSARLLQAQAQASPYLYDMYRDPQFSITQIARIIFPDTHARYPRSAVVAVTNATKMLVSPAERERLKRERLSQRRKEAIKRLFPNDFREHQQKAAKARGKLGFIGLDKALATQGRTPWSDDEKQFAKSLTTNESFLHKHGAQKGNPDYTMISNEINNMFHNGRPVRNARSINAHFADIRRQRI